MSKTILVDIVTALTANTDLTLAGNGTGNVVVDGLTMPTADGASGDVIQTDGAGNLSLATPAGGGGGLWQWVSNTDFTAASTVNFTGITGPTLFVFESMTQTDDGQYAGLRTSTDNGSTFDSGATDYSYVDPAWSGDAATANVLNSTGDTSGIIMHDMANDAGHSISGYLLIENPEDTAYTLIKTDMSYMNKTTGSVSRSQAVVSRDASAAVNAMQIFHPIGSFTGTVRRYTRIIA